jgi:peptide chain release factor
MGSRLVDRWDFPVRASKLEDLALRFEALELREEDLDERFVLGRGKGGQKVNKTHNAVQLVHGPTGVRVECHRERQRSLNRFLARRLLVEELERSAAGGSSEAEDKAREKLRKQKQRRKRRSRSKTDDAP